MELPSEGQKQEVLVDGVSFPEHWVVFSQRHAAEGADTATGSQSEELEALRTATVIKVKLLVIPGVWQKRTLVAPPFNSLHSEKVQKLWLGGTEDGLKEVF